MDKTSLNI